MKSGPPTVEPHVERPGPSEFRDPMVIRELKRIVETMDKARGTKDKFSKADIAFHLAIARGSGNRIYSILLGALEKRCIAYAQANRGDGDWSTPVISGHNEILEAIEAGLPDKAADAMRKHLLSSRRHFVDITT